MEDFFTRFDSKTKAKEKDEQQREQKARHYRELTEVFIKKLKPVVQPYLQGLEQRGFRIEVRENGAYYNVQVSDISKGKSVQLGTTHSPFASDEYFILSDFEEYGRQIIPINETFPEDKIKSFIETTFGRLL